MLSKLLQQFRERVGRAFFPVILAIFAILLFLIMYSSVEQKSVDYKEGQVAEESIRANKTVENTKATKQKKQLAAESVTPEYTYQDDLVDKQTDKVSNLFELISDTNTKIDDDYKKEQAAAKDNKTIPQPTTDERIAGLKKNFESASEEQVAFYQALPNRFYENIFEMSKDELKTVHDQTITIIQDAMTSRVRENDLDSVREKAINKLQYIDINSTQQQEITYLLNSGIVANEFLNEKKTEELKKEAENSVQPVMIYQGEIIVREGNQIDADAMEKLTILGLTSQTTSIFPVVALAVAILVQVGIVSYFSMQISDKDSRLRFIVFYVFTMLIGVSVIKLFQVFDSNNMTYIPLFFPAAFTPLVLSIFINRRAGIISALFQGLFALFIHYESVGTTVLTSVLMIYVFSGLLATVVKRQRIVEQGASAIMLIIVFPMAIIATMVVYQGMSYSDGATWMTLICGLVGCVLSFLLSIGLHPYIEQLVTDDSVATLNELSNPNHPLLKQLLEEAPGTYHHSMMVASLSANAVAEIGGRSLLTRVGCYYHDIGKIKHANFFVENLPAGVENPHNFLLPEDSRQIIFGHVTDGTKTLEEYKMPQMVIEICQQHHGTTLMSYFYVKAKERNPEVEEKDFRYPGPKPQSKEAGVVSIADSCEAAIRAMGHPTNEKIKEFVHQLIADRISDGQLDESGLTFGEIRIIEKSLVNGLASSFHSRIKYPKMKSEAEQMKEEQERRAE